MTAMHKEPNYYAIWGWLLLLTVTEVGTTFLPIGRVSIAVLLVGQALTKAMLVAMYFMHLRFETKILAMIAVTPLVLCTFLALMLLPDSTPVEPGAPGSTVEHSADGTAAEGSEPAHTE